MTGSDVTFGEWLLQQRMAAGLRQVDLAEKLGISREYLSRIETGHEPGSYDLRENVTRLLAAGREVPQFADGCPKKRGGGLMVLREEVAALRRAVESLERTVRGGLAL